MRTADRLPLLGLIGALASGIAVATLSYRGATRLAEEGEWVAHRHESIAAIERLRLDVYEADHTARIHALTGVDTWELAYLSARTRVTEDVGSLRALLAADAEQRAALDKLTLTMDTDLTTFHDAVFKLRWDESGEKLALAINLRAEEMQQPIQTTLDAMVATEKGRIDARASATREDTAALKRAIAAGSSTSFLLVIGAFVLLAREADRRRQAERRLAVTMDSIGDGVISTDEHGTVVDMNSAAERLTGWTKAEARGVSHEKVVRLRAETSNAAIASPVADVLASGEARTVAGALLVAKTGQERPVGETTAAIRAAGADVEGAVLVVRDVTEEREAESRFRRVLAAAPDAIIVAANDGRILHANDEAVRLFGHDHEALLEMTVEDLVPPRLRAGHDRHRATFAKDPSVRPMGRRPFDLVALHKDGGEVPVAINLAPFETADGALVIAVVRDVRKERDAAEALRRARDAAEGLARELESFSYSIAHDLRAPLRSIDGFSLAVLEDQAERLGEEGRQDLQRVREAVKEMSGRIDALLQLSRLSRTALRRDKVDLTKLANAVAERLRQAEPSRAVDVRVEPGLEAMGDERLLGIVIENLIGNAWKFTARTQSATISVGRDAATKAYWVRDNGAGFDMTQARRLFVAFQRLHRDTEFAGTGIGLATVQRVVHMHGGKVWAEADVGKGACFFFTLGEGE